MWYVRKHPDKEVWSNYGENLREITERYRQYEKYKDHDTSEKCYEKGRL